MAKYEDELVLKDSVSDKLDKISNKLDDMSKKMGNVENKTKSLGDSFKKFGEKANDFSRWAKTRITLPIVAAGTAMVKLAMDMEKTTAVFSTLLGSEQKATEMVANIQKLAAETPLTTRGLTKNAQLLLNFGYSAEKIIPALRMLGDIAGGNQERFNSLSLAFAQVQAAGRLTGQDLLQMVNAGFNPLKIISEQTGKSIADLRDEMGKGLISFDMIEKAMMSATAEGGKFYGLMDKQSQTASGRLSTLQDNVELLAIKLGTKLLPHVANLIEKLIALVDKFDSFDDTTQKLILTIGGLSAALPIITGLLSPLSKAFTLAVTAAGSLGTAFTVLQAHPVIFTIVKITAALTALYQIAKKVSEVLTGKMLKWFDKGTNTPEIIPMKEGETVDEYVKRIDAMKNAGINKNSSALGNVIKAQITLDAPNLFTGNQSEKSGDLLSKISEIQANNQAKTNYITKSITENPSYSNNTTNMSNVFNINGTVREEADVNKIAETIANRVSLKFGNMRNT